MCAQVAPSIADPSANRRAAERAVREAVEGGADVIVLPELMTTGYHLERSEAVGLAERAEGPSTSSWARSLAGTDAVVIGGFCERAWSGEVYNSAALVTAEGVQQVYRKIHLWDQEHKLFSRGSEPPPVVATRWGAIGVAICYDLFFPELTRGLALRGAQLLAVPTNSPWDGPRGHGAEPGNDGIGHAVARSAAYLNRVFVAVCDRHGDERGHAWTSRSSIIGPEGDFLAGPVPYEAAQLRADCDLGEAASKRWNGTVNDAFADRVPHLYGGVVGATGSIGAVSD